MLLRHYSLVLLWVLVIAGLYAIPGFDLVYTDAWDLLTFDKLAHMFLFAVLVNLLMVSFRKQFRVRTFRIHARKWSLFIAISLGALLEFMQGTYFVMRTSDPMDFLANTLGAFSGLLLFRLVYGKELSRV